MFDIGVILTELIQDKNYTNISRVSIRKQPYRGIWELKDGPLTFVLYLICICMVVVVGYIVILY